VRNIKNVVPQKQNAICKTRAQYAKRAAKINAKNTRFHKKDFKAQLQLKDITTDSEFLASQDSNLGPQNFKRWT
jgi:hypothetical protein